MTVRDQVSAAGAHVRSKRGSVLMAILSYLLPWRAWFMGTAWTTLGRTIYAPTWVDGMVADGGMNFVDVLALHLADYSKLREKLRRIERVPKTHSVQAELESASLQHLKGMRAVLVAMNPTGSPNDRRHPVPEAKVAATLARIDAVIPAGDAGDDLVN